jgi:hypothetical protein
MISNADITLSDSASRLPPPPVPDTLRVYKQGHPQPELGPSRKRKGSQFGDSSATSSKRAQINSGNRNVSGMSAPAQENLEGFGRVRATILNVLLSLLTDFLKTSMEGYTQNAGPSTSGYAQMPSQQPMNTSQELLAAAIQFNQSTTYLNRLKNGLLGVSFILFVLYLRR